MEVIKKAARTGAGTIQHRKADTRKGIKRKTHTKKKKKKKE